MFTYAAWCGGCEAAQVVQVSGLGRCSPEEGGSKSNIQYYLATAMTSCQL